MQQDTSLKIHPLELKHFLRHVCMASKQHKEREEAREKLYKQVRKISLGKVKKEDVEKELSQLNEKIDLVLQKEGKLLKYIRVDEDTVKHLTQKIRTLEKQLAMAKKERDKAVVSKDEIKRLTEVIAHIRSKIHELLKAKTYREERIKELEEKIKKSKHPFP